MSNLKILFLILFTVNSVMSLNVVSDSNLSLNETILNNLVTNAMETMLSNCIKDLMTDIINLNQFSQDAVLLNPGKIKITTLHTNKIILTIRSSEFSNYTYYTQLYIISANNLEDLISTFNSSRTKLHWNPLAYFVIVIENNFEENLDTARDYFRFVNIYNVTFVSRARDDYNIYAFNSPLRYCENSMKLIYVEQCSKYRIGTQLYPVADKKSLNNCHIKVAALNIFPFVNFDGKVHDGIEVMMINRLAEYCDIKIDIIEYNIKMNSYGNPVQEFMYSDILDQVANGEVQGAIGGYNLYLNSLSRASPIYPLCIDHIVVIMPKAEFLGAWEALTLKSYNIIAYTLVLLLILSVFSYVLRLFSNTADFTSHVLIVYGSLFYQVVPIASKKGITRKIILLCIFCGMFILPFGFQASLSSVKTSALTGYDPTDFDDIVDNYEVVVPKNWNKLPKFKYGPDCESRLECLKFIRDFKSKTYYTMISDIMFQYYKWKLVNENCELKLYQIKDIAFTVMSTMYFRRGSPFLKYFNNYLFRATEFGLMKLDRCMELHRQSLHCKCHSKPKFVSLHLGELRLPFLTLVVGISASVIVFIFELFNR